MIPDRTLNSTVFLSFRVVCLIVVNSNDSLISWIFAWSSRMLISVFAVRFPFTSFMQETEVLGLIANIRRSSDSLRVH